jgi:two-component system, LytTR family, sensor histidine kinase AlgZ
VDATLPATLRALAEPRRLVPIVAVAVPLILVQGSLSADPLAAPLGAALCLAFLVVGPWSWRRLGGRALGIVAYAAIGAAVVLAFGKGVPRLVGMGHTFLTGDGPLLVCAALYLVGGWGLGRDIGLEREARLAQLLALRSHLDPHFLFNALNAIAEWCRQDGEVAERAVLELAALLRGVLQGVRQGTWPLGREIELTRGLLALHLLRDPTLFEPRLAVDGGLDDVEVPTLILLPLAENAVKHGPAAGHRGPIVLTARRVDGAVEVVVENPGRYRGPREGGEGLPSVRERLAFVYGRRARLDVGAVDDRTVARLRLPEAP